MRSRQGRNTQITVNRPYATLHVFRTGITDVVINFRHIQASLSSNESEYSLIGM